jgi:hypothetical protein
MPAPSLLYILLFAAFMLNPVPAQKESRHRHAEKRPSTEPFRSFAILDSQLSLLTTQQSALQASESSGPALPTIANASSQSQMALLNNMNATTTIIIGRANHLENLYRRQHRQFGVRTFKIMGLKARRVRHQLAAVKKARGLARQDAAKRLAERITTLVVHFQAVSGGHEVTHCSPREWICCQPKRTKDLMPGEEVGCRWMCTPKANQCTGLLGPRIPRLSAMR